MKRIFFDFSTMGGFSGHATGIPRTVIELGRAFKNLNKSISYVALDNEKGEFCVFDPQSLKYCENADFKKDDWLFSASAGWAFSNYNKVVNKNLVRGVRFAQLYYDLIPYLFPHFYENPFFGSYYYKWVQ